MLQDTKQSSGGTYVPPHRRRAGAQVTKVPTPPQASKFDSILRSHDRERQLDTRVKASSSWGRRDGRDGFIPPEVSDELAELLSQHHSGRVGSSEATPASDFTISEEFPIVSSFSDCEVHPTLLANLDALSYTKPTPIQSYALPAQLMRRDLIACAQTGSGKTAAYLFPMIAKMLQDGPPHFTRSRMAMPVGLVLSPTRELAVQIYAETVKMCAGTGIRAAVIYGGSDGRAQFATLDRGVDILVATPGRLIDLLNRTKISLQAIKYLVLDEADRMLDMGFEPQIRTILSSENMPVNRETTMCSATFPPEIQALATSFLKSYVFLAVGKAGSAVATVTHDVRFVDEIEKRQELHAALEQCPGKTLVFSETKRGVDLIEEFLSRAGYAVTSIHGDRSQPAREHALAQFKSGAVEILVATDVAARGLDIPDITTVVNYDCPTNTEDYVHRIGRTGRNGNAGTAITFFNHKNSGLARKLRTLLLKSEQTVPAWLQTYGSGRMSHRFR